MIPHAETFAPVVTIGKRSVGKGHPVFIIAEAGVNHNGDVDTARRLIDCAVAAGADAVKFQTFTARRLNTRTAPKSSYHLRATPPDAEESWYDLLRRQEMDREMHVTLKTHCRQTGIVFLSTPYDFQSVDLLDELDVPAFKIASTDANNTPFLSYVAAKGRPILLSTGMCTMGEVSDAVRAVSGAGNRELILLHCTANYPADLDTANLLAMTTLSSTFEVPVGYSDHCPQRTAPIAAVALGAVVVEKHFTLSRDLPGPDHQASLLPEELRTLVHDVRRTQKALGSPEKAPQPCEMENRLKLRKSIVSDTFIAKGSIITLEMLAFKRPGTGLPPGRIDAVTGRRAARDIPSDTLIFLDMLEIPHA